MAHDWEVGDEITKPCVHAEPQAASCLHGVCIFCWRDRCATLRARLAKIDKAASMIVAIDETSVLALAKIRRLAKGE